MSATQVNVDRPQFGQVYMWSLVIAGAAIALGSLVLFPFQKLDAPFFFLCLMVMASALIAPPPARAPPRASAAAAMHAHALSRRQP